MVPETSELLRMWSFHRAPSEFRDLFPEGESEDWLACVPFNLRETLEPGLLRWRVAYPVTAVEVPGAGILYWGAPRFAIRSIANHYDLIASRLPNEDERRGAARFQLYCPSRYETLSEPKYAGSGYTIDISNTGIAFTTESLLPQDVDVSLMIRWPVELEGGVPIELCAAGRVTRTEQAKAALQLQKIHFATTP